MGNVLQAGQGQAPTTQALIYAGILDYSYGLIIRNKNFQSMNRSSRFAKHHASDHDQQSVRVGHEIGDDGSSIDRVRTPERHCGWWHGVHVQCAVLYEPRRAGLWWCHAHRWHCVRWSHRRLQQDSYGSNRKFISILKRQFLFCYIL